jgi:hypothetical protein
LLSGQGEAQEAPSPPAGHAADVEDGLADDGGHAGPAGGRPLGDAEVLGSPGRVARKTGSVTWATGVSLTWAAPRSGLAGVVVVGAAVVAAAVVAGPPGVVVAVVGGALVLAVVVAVVAVAAPVAEVAVVALVSPASLSSLHAANGTSDDGPGGQAAFNGGRG